MKKLLVIIMAFIMVAFGAGCTTKGTDSEEVQKNGKLAVGITHYQPMNYKVDGEWTGFDTEFARLFAKEKLGVEVEFVEINWAERYDLLNDYKIDCVWNGMTLDQDLQEGVSVSDAYVLNSQVLVMKADVVDNYKTGYDVRLLKFAAESESAGYYSIKRENYKNLTLVETQEQALELVNNGTVDATIIDSVMASALVGEGKTYFNLAKGFSYSSEAFGVAFREGSDLTNMLNEFMEEIWDEELLELAEKYNLTLA